MMIYIKQSLRFVMLLLLIGGGILVWIRCKDRKQDEDYVDTLFHLPAEVLKVSNRAVPGGEVVAASEELYAEVVYRIDKTVNSTQYAIKVTSDGVVKEIAREASEDKPIPHIGEISGKQIRELSGIVPAKKEGEYWGHNGEGNDTAIYRFSIRGEILQKVSLNGAENVDWEGMTVDSDGAFYIGDFGDNDLKREFYSIYRLTEPEKPALEADVYDSYRFKYADERPRDCEAVFVMDDKLYLITRGNIGNESQEIFCIDKLEAGQTIQARVVGRMDIKDSVTDADYSNSYKQLAVLTQNRIVFQNVAEELDLLQNPIRSIRVRFDKAKAICYDSDYLVITGKSGKIWKYPMEIFLKR